MAKYKLSAQEIDAINKGYAEIDRASLSTHAECVSSVHKALGALDIGEESINEKQDGIWCVNEHLKKAILLAFKLWPCKLHKDNGNICYDKIPLKFAGWATEDFNHASIRCAPSSVVRYASYIANNVALMPHSFVNIGAYVGHNTMIDAGATVGSCAYVGSNCHISGGTGIGGVLEPIQERPVIIEDDCFIGARCEIAEGIIIGSGSVIAMGTTIGASTKIICRSSGKTYTGAVPENSVVVPGSYKHSDDYHIGCAIIVKQVDGITKDKTKLNALLRSL